MSIKLSQLRTYWTADDAHLIISFLDELRDVLWATYGAEIIEEQRRKNQPPDRQDTPQEWLDIDKGGEF